MTREVLQAILRGAKGSSEKSGGVFQFESEHRASLHLGQDGWAIVVQEVESVKLNDAYLCITSRELGEVSSAYESVQAVVVKPPKESGPKKTGFA